MITNASLSIPKIPLRVLIADGSEIITEGLTAALTDQACILVVGSASKAIQALALIESVQPDVVLLDLQMPGDSLTSLLRLIKRAKVVPIVMVLAPYTSTVLRERCLNAGADYVFAMTAELETMTETLQKLVAAKNSGAKVNQREPKVMGSEQSQ